MLSDVLGEKVLEGSGMSFLGKKLNQPAEVIGYVPFLCVPGSSLEYRPFFGNRMKIPLVPQSSIW